MTEIGKESFAKKTEALDQYGRADHLEPERGEYVQLLSRLFLYADHDMSPEFKKAYEAEVNERLDWYTKHFTLAWTDKVEKTSHATLVEK